MTRRQRGGGGGSRLCAPPRPCQLMSHPLRAPCSGVRSSKAGAVRAWAILMRGIFLAGFWPCGFPAWWDPDENRIWYLQLLFALPAKTWTAFCSVAAYKHHDSISCTVEFRLLSFLPSHVMTSTQNTPPYSGNPKTASRTPSRPRGCWRGRARTSIRFHACDNFSTDF